MTFETADLYALAPEIILLTMGCLILVIDAYLPEKLRALTYQMTQATLIGTALVAFGMYPEQEIIAMSGMFVLDGMATVLKVFVLGIVAVGFTYSRGYLKDRGLLKGEYFVLGLFATLGMLVMISAANLLTIYLGLELLSLSLYAMVAINRDSRAASEAAMKYFVLGALASGMLLYGISMLYGATGTLELANIATEAAKVEDGNKLIFIFGIVFVVIGLGFKLGAVPFHMWVPDIYEGSPTPVTLFISTAPKLAAFAMIMRLLVDGLEHFNADWQQMLMILSVISIATGNIIAIAQTNIKRMFAYSTIAHVGFLLLGFVTGTEEGYAASMFYAIVYAVTALGGFGILLLLSRAGFESDKIEDLKGLNERNSWYAFMMMIFILSMAGAPPMLGFWAKLSVVSEVVDAGYTSLAVWAVVFSVVGAFYYLRVLKMIYFSKPEEDAPKITANVDMHLALSANGIAILALGLKPGALMAICLAAIGVSV